MICPHCQKEIPDNAQACIHCWKDIPDVTTESKQLPSIKSPLSKSDSAYDASGWDSIAGEKVLYKAQTAGSWIIGYAGVFVLSIFFLCIIAVVIGEAFGSTQLAEESIVSMESQTTQSESDSSPVGMIFSMIWGLFIWGAFFRWSYRELRFYHGTYYLATPEHLLLGIDFLWEAKRVQPLLAWKDVVAIYEGEKTTICFGNGKNIQLRDRDSELFEYLYPIWQNAINPSSDDGKLWVQRAHEGDPEAQFNLAMSANRGESPSPQCVNYWLRKSAEQGYAPAEYALAVHQYSSASIPESVELIRKSAEQNYAPALYKLANLYFYGVNRETDNYHFGINPSKGIECLRKAIELKYDLAFVQLGICYITGLGIGKDVDKAIENWHIAADLGNEAGEFNLGLLYERGEDVPQNMQEAIKWYRRAAEQGYPSAQTKLGIFYITGKDIDKDVVEGARWLTRAAEQNDSEALYLLSICYQNGDGVEKNDNVALDLLFKSAQDGYPHAQYVLSTLCKDKKEEIKWLKLAAEQGHPQAKKALEEKDKQLCNQK